MIELETLVDERRGTITCPRCERTQPRQDYITLGRSQRYQWQLNPIFRCRQCHHLFAPRSAVSEAAAQPRPSYWAAIEAER
ncbi:MAG: hypothetical protein HY329_08045 [Chloroflexi bacterium]|nr:hypothetical protein [Chloroflexota bacterium]